MNEKMTRMYEICNSGEAIEGALRTELEDIITMFLENGTKEEKEIASYIKGKILDK